MTRRALGFRAQDGPIKPGGFIGFSRFSKGLVDGYCQQLSYAGF